jgi:alkylation response protein AidB-like acyl-CoA dehydrogenase
MTVPVLNRRDLEFVLFELLDAEALCARARFAEHGRETFQAALDTAEAIATAHFAPHNRKADVNEPRLGPDGKVVLLPEVKAAFDAFNRAGFTAAHFDTARGGMQLPWLVTQGCFAFFQAANIATFAYPFLSVAGANLLDAFGSQEQKALYLAPLLEGRFCATMALTEPQAGSSLADIRTRAEPAADGSYRLSGQKMFISAGEHELAENIVHLVLARISGGPPGAKGISLFIVPKYLVDADGRCGARNDVALAGLIHKTGYRGTSSTILNFGERGACVGYLVGEANRGLAYMFHMMNEARIGVGMGATMLGVAGYLHSLDYARGRVQGRPADAKASAAPPVRIVEHADVRRMLLAQKALTEGCLALCLTTARLVDDAHTAPDEDTRRKASLLLDLLTPIVKAWPSEQGLRANDLAIQVLGGYGYTREFPVEQFWRDNRLNPIHEGTNGIQALDLVGRKLAQAEGVGFEFLMRRIWASAEAAKEVPALARWAEALAVAAARSEEAVAMLAAARGDGKLALALANAHPLLDLMGLLVVAWLWLDMARIAAGRVEAASGAERDFYEGKLRACRYFYGWELPRLDPLAELVGRLDATCLEMEDRFF